MKKIMLFIFIIFGLQSNVCASPVTPGSLISEPYKKMHNLVLSTAITAYYTAIDINDQNQNMHEWNIDYVTWIAFVIRTLMYSVINYYEGSYLPDHKATMTPEQIVRYRKLLAIGATTLGMLTYNINFKKMVIDRFSKTKESLTEYVPAWAASLLSGLNILVRNLVWWYTIPVPLRKINTWWYDKMPRQQAFSQMAYDKTKSIILAHIIFSLADIAYQDILVSLKHTVSQIIPFGSASDFSAGRFGDCTLGYFGSNLLGKNGPLGEFIMPVANTTQALQNNATQAMKNTMVPLLQDLERQAIDFIYNNKPNDVFNEHGHDATVPEP